MWNVVATGIRFPNAIANENINLIIKKNGAIECIAKNNCPKFAFFLNIFAKIKIIIATADKNNPRRIIVLIILYNEKK